jgi:uncharacterized protein YdhG (YjbR/CyaY superfamily)
MTIPAQSVAEYLEQVPADKRPAFEKLHQTIQAHIPEGFEACISYGMIGYVVPHTLYPKGYHCNPKLALPFVSIACQKNFIAIYHMGIYTDETLLEWFQSEHEKRASVKLDMGKSCIRYKKPDTIPYDLIGDLVSKMTVQDWVGKYESLLLPSNKKK